MAIDTIPWDTAEYLDTTDKVLAYLEAVFEDGDPELISVALANVARARGVASDDLSARTDIGEIIRTMKAMGLELTAKAA